MGTRLPDDHRCGDCTHIARCNYLMGILPENYECDFDPIRFSLETQEFCPDCDGTGEVAGDYWSDDGMTPCLRCNGKGVI